MEAIRKLYWFPNNNNNMRLIVRLARFSSILYESEAVHIRSSLRPDIVWWNGPQALDYCRS